MGKNKLKVLPFLMIAVCMIAGGCKKEENASQTAKPNAGSSQISESIQNDNEVIQNDDNKKEPEATEIAEPEMKGKISVSSFLKNEFLDAAAKQFMKEYPEVTVVINEYAENIAEPSEKDYQTMFNTKLMSGDAEDIIVNSFLPVAKYSEMGAFEDLSKYISQETELTEKNYFMNVIKSAEQVNGEIYLLPYMVRFDVMDFDDALIQEQKDVKNMLNRMKSIRFSDGMNLAKQLVENTKKNNTYLSIQSPVQIMTYLIKDRLSEFVDIKDKKVSIDTEEYIKLLESVKNMENIGYFDTDGINFYNTECYIAEMIDYDMQAAFLAVSNRQEEPYSAMPLVDVEGNIYLNPNYCLMLNSGSPHKELAWEFIKYLLSEQVQKLPSTHGIPVNRKAFEKAVKRDYDKCKAENSEAGQLENYQSILKDWVEQINACDILDPSLVNMLEEENEKFFEGKQSEKETAKRLQRKIEQYFYE